MQAFVTAGVLVGAVAAQGATYVVDRLGGPGAQFIEIDSAVAAVPSGSTLLVRPGAYAPVLVDGKGIVILCEAGVTAGSASTFAPFLCVQNTLPPQVVAVRGLGTVGPLGCKLIDCAGPVTIDGVGATVAVPWYFGSALDIVNCAQVGIRDWILQGSAPCWVTDSTVVFENCVLQGDSAAFQSGYPGLNAENSDVQAVFTSLSGGHGLSGPPTVTRPGSEAVVLTNASFRAIGTRQHTIVGGMDPVLGQLPGIGGSGVARVDPQIVIGGAPPAGPQVALTRPTMPGLASDSAVRGGTLTVRRRGALGVLGLIVIGLRGSSQTVPGITDPIWVDASTFVIKAAGIVTADPWLVQQDVPALPALVGLQLVWQAADLAAGGVEVSNPSSTMIR